MSCFKDYSSYFNIIFNVLYQHKKKATGDIATNLHDGNYGNQTILPWSNHVEHILEENWMN